MEPRSAAHQRVNLVVDRANDHYVQEWRDLRTYEVTFHKEGRLSDPTVHGESARRPKRPDGSEQQAEAHEARAVRSEVAQNLRSALRLLLSSDYSGPLETVHLRKPVLGSPSTSRPALLGEQSVLLLQKARLGARLLRRLLRRSRALR